MVSGLHSLADSETSTKAGSIKCETDITKLQLIPAISPNLGCPSKPNVLRRYRPTIQLRPILPKECPHPSVVFAASLRKQTTGSSQHTIPPLRPPTQDSGTKQKKSEAIVSCSQ